MSETLRSMYADEAVANRETTISDLSENDQRSFQSVASRYAARSRARSHEWSSDDVRQLRELAGAGTSPEAIAVILRRTASAIRNKAGMHGISLRGRR